MHNYKCSSIFLIHSVLKRYHFRILANDTVPAVINTTENIGDEVNINYKVRNSNQNVIIKELVPFFLICSEYINNPIIIYCLSARSVTC